MDERTGQIHDYTRKTGVDRDGSGIVLPAGAPEWAGDRAALWNAAEQSEMRKNSTVAREFEIALPHELDPSDRAKLAHAFAAEIVARHGCAVDVCIHAPSEQGDQRNHHAHLLLSTRRLGPDGFHEKTRELDDKKTGPQIVTEWRERWAAMQNEMLAERGIAARVDHRTLAAQRDEAAERGDVVTYALLDRLPTVKQGPKATAMQRRGEATERGQMAADVATENAQRPARLAGELAQVIDLAAERQRRAAEPYRTAAMDMLSIDLSVLDAPSATAMPPAPLELSVLDAPAPKPVQPPARPPQRTREDLRRELIGDPLPTPTPKTVPREANPTPAPGVQPEKPTRPSWAERKAEMERKQAEEMAAIEAAGQRAEQRRLEANRDSNISSAVRLIEGAAALRAARHPDWANGGAAWSAMPEGMQAMVQRLSELNPEGRDMVAAQLRKQATPEGAAKAREQIETAYRAGREQQAKRLQDKQRGGDGPGLGR